jgi:pyruvate kinase
VSLPPCKTKIIGTIGPASSTPAVMEKMIWAGMNVARLNLSHGDFTAHANVIDRLRKASQAAGRPLAIMADLPGPKIRVGQLADDPTELTAGTTFTLTSEPDVSEPRRVSVTFDRLPAVVKPGDTLFLNDGLVQAEITEVTGHDVVCRIVVGGQLRSRKGLSLPGIDLGTSAFTPRDRECLQFALEHGADIIAQSFIESAVDVRALREAAAELGHPHPFVIAKLERVRARDHVGEILAEADGIMVARGDLGIEVPIERMALAQKYLIREANLAGKPVVTATEMLESMTWHRRPTRAEVNDVANAVLDGTDAVMLSGESATGRYPVECVEMLARIASTMESFRAAPWVRDPVRTTGPGEGPNIADVIAASVDATVERVAAAAVVVPTRTGETVRQIARFRLPIWVVAVCDQESICQQLRLTYGVHPVYEPNPPEDWSAFARQWARDHGASGRSVVLAAGPSARHPDASHRIEIIEI